MISYDKYQNRIKRLAAVKNFIVRFRALFIALFALLIAASLTLMFTKGVITQTIILPDKIIYGDNYATSIEPPKAFLSDVEYQFKSVNEGENSKSAVKYEIAKDTEDEDGWTYELPTYAGKYLVRMVSNKIFGKSYSQPKQFEIETYSTQFLINSDSIVYGEMPDSYTFNLVNGDRLIVEGLIFDYENPAADITEICANADSFKIVNSKDEDVTFCYNISVPKKAGVNILQQDATIELQDVTTVYSGEEVEYENSVYYLNGGEAHVKTLIYDSNDNLLQGNPVNAGVYTVKIVREETKVFSGESDVTRHYNFDYKNATITINKRPITVATESGTKEYDGTPFKNTSFYYENLISGHYCRAVFKKDFIDVGAYSNQCDISIFGRENEDVSDNYEITLNFGELKITPRIINVVTHGAKKIYDGTPFEKTSFSVVKDGQDALISGHVAVPDYNYFDYEAGTYENKFSIRIVDDDNIPVTEGNYEIHYTYGTLEILKRAISVITASDSWMYDGDAHFNEYIEYSLLSEIGKGEKTLVDGDEIAVVGRTEVTDFTEDGVKNALVCAISKYGHDVTNSYDIKYIEGTLKIEKRPLVITTPTISKDYDGTPLFGTEKVSSADNLVWCDRIGYVTKVASILGCGTVENKTHFSIRDLYDSLYDKTENYEIEYVYGTLEVTVRDITVVRPTMDKTYDGTPLKGDKFIPQLSDIENHKYIAYNVSEITDVGEIDNDTLYKIVRLDESGETDVTEYFNISYGDGTLTVVKRDLWIVTADASLEYDGISSLSCPEGKEYLAYPESNKPYGLVENQKIVLDGSIEPASIAYVGSTPNVVFFKVFDGDRDVSENYEIWYKHGTLTISPRIVLVTTADDEWTYDAKPHSNGLAKTTHVSLKGGEYIADNKDDFVLDHKLELIYAIEEINVGYYSNVCEYTVIDENGNDVSYNYNLVVNYGALNILPRPVKITTQSGHREYDNRPFYLLEPIAEEYDEEAQRGLIKGHELECEQGLSASVTYVTEGKVTNWQFYYIYTISEEGNRVYITQNNYDIEYVYGEIFVTPRPITIITATSSSEYNGVWYWDTDYTLIGELAEDTYLSVVGEHTYVTYVTEGEVENVVTYYVVDYSRNKDVTDNYEISYIYGKIWRTPRTIQVTTNSHNWTYDGTAHSDTGYEVLHLGADGKPDYWDAFAEAWHTLVVVGTPTEVTNYTGNSVANIVKYIVLDEETTQNYSIVMAYGELSISKRPIVITTASNEKVYDGEPYCNPSGWSIEGDYDIDGYKHGYSLVKGHGLYVKVNEDDTPVLITYITDVKWENGEVVGVENRAEYDIFDVDSGVNVSFNYEILGYVYGTLTRTPRPLTITTHTKDREYNGTKFSYTYFDTEKFNSAIDRGIVSGHEARLILEEFIAWVTYVHEGKVKNEFSVTIVDLHGNGITEFGNPIVENYKIEYEYGEIYITPHTIYVTNPTKEESYFGDWLFGGDAGIFESVLFEGDMAYVFKEAMIVDVGTVVNNTTYKIKNLKDDIEITDSYNIQCADGKLTLTPIPLTIKTATLKKVYDGTPLYGAEELNEAEISVVEDVRIEGITGYDWIEFDEDSVASRTVVGDTENRTRYIVYSHRYGVLTDITKNYEPQYDYGTLTVTVREITIKTKTDSHEYDGQEYTGADGWEDIGELKLVKDHTLAVVETIGAITDVKRDGEGNIIGVENKVIYKVVDGSGNDGVNENYHINYEYGEISVTPRNILITTKSNSWVYDSEGHYDNRYEKAVHTDKYGVEDGNPLVLVDEHTLVPIEGTATVVVNYTAEKVVNEVKFVVKMGEKDVTGNYNISYTEGELAGKLEITRRPVTIETSTKENEYNGQPFSFTYFLYEPFNRENNSGIVTSIHKAVQYGDDYATVTYVHEGKVENIFTVKIVARDGSEETEDGFEINENYTIIYNYGFISITPHGITVTNTTVVRAYSGYWHHGADITIFYGKLFGEDYCVADVIAKIIDVGTVKNDTTYKIYNAEGIVITDSYEIEYIDGKLTLTAIELKIWTAEFEKVYDGQPLYGAEGFNEEDITVIKWTRILGLADNDRIEVDEANISSQTDKGRVENNTKFIVYGLRDGKWVDVTFNYGEPIYENGYLEVKIREITIKTKTDSHEYDGQEYTGADGWEDTGELKLVDGHTLAVVEIIGSITDVMRDDEGNIIGVTNKVIYKVVDGNGNDAVNENYQINYDYGEISVTPRQITITTATDSKEYDGTPLKNAEEITVTEGSIVKGHICVVDDSVEIPYVTYVSDGAVSNILKYLIFNAGVDVSYNYEITYVYGTLTIKPRKVSIILNTVENMVYGDEFKGYPLANGSMFTYAEGSKQTVEGETLEITVKYQLNGVDIIDTSKLNAGEYYVVLDGISIIGGSIDNYEISYTASTFAVERRAITISLLEDKDGGKIYDGYRYEFDLQNGYEVSSGNIVDGDKLEIAVRYLLNGSIESTPLNAGAYTIVFDNDNCTVNGEKELALNYEITCIIKEVAYVITQRPLLFVLNDLTHEYTGIVYYEYKNDEAMSFDEKQLADTDELVNVSATTMLDGEIYGAIEIGEYDIVVYEFTVSRKDDSSVDVTQNYYLSGDQLNAKLTITERVIKVSVRFNDIASRDYSGEEIDLIKEYPDYGPYTSEPVSEEQCSWGIYPDDLDKIDAVFSFQKGGKYVALKDLGKYTVSVTLQDKVGCDVLKNYTISYATSEFEITRRRINIIPKITANRLEYNGEVLDAKYLDYDTRHYFSNASGFINESDKDDYHAEYSLYAVGDASVNIIDEILQAGEYYLKIKLTYIGTGEEQYLITYKFESAPFTVYQRTIYANTPDDTNEYVYNKTAVSNPQEFYTYYYDYSSDQWKSGGFVNNDGDGAIPQYSYFKDYEGFDAAVDAGEYTIKIVGFGGSNSAYIERNYNVQLDAYEYGALIHGKIVIKPALLVVAPKDYSEPYNGALEFELPSHCYIIKYVEGNTELNLFGNDELSFTASGKIDIRKSNAARVTFTGVQIKDGKRDVTTNYDIVCNYTQYRNNDTIKNNCPDSVKGLTQADFIGILSFEQLDLRIKQPAPPSGYSEVQYGTNTSITLKDESSKLIPIGNILNPDEVIDVNKIVIGTARVVAIDMADVTQWVYMCKVYNSNNIDVSKVYNVIIVCEEDSYIKVRKRELVIQVNFALNDLEEGYTLTTNDYSITTGSLVYGATIEITVQNGACVADIKSRVGDEDHNSRYAVTFNYLDENTVKEAEDASRIYLLLSRRAEIIRKDDIPE